MLLLLLCNVFTLSAAEELYAQHYNVTLSLRNATVKEAVDAVNGIMIVTADHGNADEMLAEDGGPKTSHTTNPVPLWVTVPGLELRSGGRLADLAPTVLELMGLSQPDEMTGTSLIV